MKNVLLIARREYLERVGSRGFLLLTLLGIAILVGGLFAPAIIGRVQTASRVDVAVVASPSLVALLSESVPDRFPNGERVITFERFASSRQARAAIQAGRLDSILTISERGGRLSAVYERRRPGTEIQRIQLGLNGVSMALSLRNSGLSEQQITDLTRTVPLKTEGATSTLEAFRSSQVSTYGFLLLLYIAVTSYGSFVSSSISAEKGSRTMELLLVSVRPRDHLAGKILGLGALGATQYAAYLSVLGLAVAAKTAGWIDIGPSVTELNVRAMLYFGLFFLLGFLLFSALHAAGACVVSGPEQNSQLALPLSLLAMFGFLVAIVILGDPENELARTLSFVPPFVPMVMFARAALGTAAPWEIALGSGVLVVTTVVVVSFAARVYRIGVLMYGSSPSLHQIVRYALVGEK